MKIKLPWLLLLFLLGTPVLAQTNNYCTASANSNHYAATNNITIGGITSNPTLGYSLYPGYTDHSALSTDTTLGDTLSFSIDVGRYGQSAAYYKIYVDFNGDGVFSESENVYDVGPASKNVSGTIKIPTDAKLGPTRIRFIQSVSEIGAPCGVIGSNGEVDDYSLTIKCNLPTPTAASVTYCGPTTANLSVTNPVSNLSYSWYSSLTNGSLLGTGTNYSAFANSSTTVYLQAQNNQGCPSARTPVNITINNCCSTSAYKMVLLSQIYTQKDDLSLLITNNQATTQTFTVTIPSGNTNTYSASTTSVGPISLAPGQTTSVRFSGRFPFANGTYNQTIILNDGKCKLSYVLPVKVDDTSLGFGDAFKVISIAPNPFVDSFVLTNSSMYTGSYKVWDPSHTNLVTSGNFSYNSQTNISLAGLRSVLGTVYGSGNYTLDIYMQGLSKSYTITRK